MKGARKHDNQLLSQGLRQLFVEQQTHGSGRDADRSALALGRASQAPANVIWSELHGGVGLLPSQGPDRATCAVMNGDDVNDLGRHDPIDDAVRPTHNLTKHRIWKFLDHSTEVRKVSERIDCTDQTTDHDLRVGWRIALDERLSRCEVSLRPSGPMQRDHARKRFLISS